MKCCFVGHRDIVGIKDLIYSEIKRLIKFGVNEFYSGGMGNFDRMCEMVTRDLGGKLIFVPYNIKQIKEKDKLWYDDIICPNIHKSYSKYDIPNRNKWMVNNCDIILCCVYKEGGAKNTFDYAVGKNKLIVNIY